MTKKEWDAGLLKMASNLQPPDEPTKPTLEQGSTINNSQITELMTTMINATINKKITVEKESKKMVDIDLNTNCLFGYREMNTTNKDTVKPKESSYTWYTKTRIFKVYEIHKTKTCSRPPSSTIRQSNQQD